MSSEVDILITQDGVSYLLGGGGAGRYVLSDEGSGMPDIEYITQRGPFQDGETVRDFFLRPRVLQFHIRQKFCSRREYLDGRNTLLSILAPNRSASRGQPQATLRRVRADGTKRDIKVVVESGPNFQPRNLNSWAEWTIDEIIRFIAHDPTYYNPNVHTETFQNTGFPYTFPIFLVSSVFPITFPLIFEGLDTTRDIIYPGTWLTYPVFDIAGPSDYTKIENLTTNEKIIYRRQIAVGQTIRIDLSYGQKRVYDLADPNTSLMGYISTDSDLTTWHIEPRVTNTVQISAGSTGQSTLITMTYNERYIGV